MRFLGSSLNQSIEKQNCPSTKCGTLSHQDFLETNGLTNSFKGSLMLTSLSMAPETIFSSAMAAQKKHSPFMAVAGSIFKGEVPSQVLFSEGNIHCVYKVGYPEESFISMLDMRGSTVHYTG